MSQINILDLPDLIQHQILLHLNPNSLLKLREVCKTTLNWVNNSRQRFSNWENFQITIEEKGWKNFETLLKTEFKISNLYICNETVDFYNNPFIPGFLQKYGTHIKKLKIRRFFARSFEKEMQFLQGLPNLNELELEQSDFKEERVPNLQDFQNRFSFRNIKILKFGDATECPYYYTLLSHWNFINSTYDLEYLKYPKIIQEKNDDILPNVIDIIDMGKMLEFLKNTSNLKYFDIEHIHHKCFKSEGYFLTFVNLCQAKGITLINVEAHHFNLNYIPRNIDCIISIKNFHPKIRDWNITILEKISIKTSNSDFNGNNDIVWPLLKTIEVEFDSEISINVYSLICIFVRPSVESFKLNFHSRNPYYQLNFNSPMPAIRSSDIIRCFPNLKKLELFGLYKKLISFVKLWEGLRTLEEIYIEDCKELADQDFIGQNSQQPAFLNLTGLKKLTLSQLDSMPGITDRSFETVFRHMQLREFRIFSNFPVLNITAAGIKSLLDGQFRTSIVNFPFNTWSASQIPSNEFNDLANKLTFIR